MRVYVTPDCCDQVRQTRAVVLRCVDGRESPSWIVRVEFALGDYEMICDRARRDRSTPSEAWTAICAAGWCPHCGSPVPAVEPRPGIRSPIQRVVDGDCVNCDPSSHCSCLPPEATWQPAGGDALDVDALWAREQGEEI